mmetsp:Transcript_51570/g.129553  ORF Transcript_51570/g.129553 Transcript_51570/m.129553 type:complete len:299 (-) Transcript_51570:420-1316(-)
MKKLPHRVTGNPQSGFMAELHRASTDRFEPGRTSSFSQLPHWLLAGLGKAARRLVVSCNPSICVELCHRNGSCLGMRVVLSIACCPCLLVLQALSFSCLFMAPICSFRAVTSPLMASMDSCGSSLRFEASNWLALLLSLLSGRCSSVFISHRGALEGLVLSASLFFVRIPPVWTLFAQQPSHSHLRLIPQLPNELECGGVDTSGEHVALHLEWERLDKQTDGVLLTHIGTSMKAFSFSFWTSVRDLLRPNCFSKYPKRASSLAGPSPFKNTPFGSDSCRSSHSSCLLHALVWHHIQVV